MSVTMLEASAQVVRGPGGRVVVIFWGEDAEAEAARWAEDGYQIDTIEQRSLRP